MTLNSLLNAHAAHPTAATAAALGQAYRDLRDLEPALHYCELARELEPDSLQHWSTHADVLATAGRLRDALTVYRGALDRGADAAATHARLGRICLDLGVDDEAADHFVRALTLDARQSRCWEGLATLSAAADIGVDDTVARLSPRPAADDDGPMLRGVAAACASVGRSLDAKEVLLRRLRRAPDDARALAALGDVEINLCDLEAAERAYARAVDAATRASSPFVHLAFTYYLQFLFLLGRVEEAQAIYRARLHSSGGYTLGHIGRQHSEIREWRGESLEGKTVLLSMIADEIGHGDALQSVRFARPLRDLGARVVVECHGLMHRLMTTVAGAERVVTGYSELPAIDYYVSGGIVALQIDPFGVPVPYLYAPAPLVDAWRKRLGSRERQRQHERGHGRGPLRVGLHWGPAPSRRIDPARHRSIPLEALAPLAQIPEVELWSLQVGPGWEQRARVPFTVHPLSLTDFADTAALIESLDVVVTNDTSTAHLAGALGKPCLMMLAFVACWRWMLNRADTPFYPATRLYRQQHPGDWSSAVTPLAADLAAMAAGRPRDDGANSHTHGMTEGALPVTGAS